MLNKGAALSTNETRAEGIQACSMLANTQVFSQKTHRIKKQTRQQRGGSWLNKRKMEGKINNKLSQPRTHRTITKKKRPSSTIIPEGLLSKGLNKEF